MTEEIESPFSYRKLKALVREMNAEIYALKKKYKKAQREFKPVNKDTANSHASLIAHTLKIRVGRVKILNYMATWWKKGRRQGEPLNYGRDWRSGTTVKEIVAECQPNAIEDLAALADD